MYEFFRLQYEKTQTNESLIYIVLGRHEWVSNIQITESVPSLRHGRAVGRTGSVIMSIANVNVLMSGVMHKHK